MWEYDLVHEWRGSGRAVVLEDPDVGLEVEHDAVDMASVVSGVGLGIRAFHDVHVGDVGLVEVELMSEVDGLVGGVRLVGSRVREVGSLGVGVDEDECALRRVVSANLRREGLPPLAIDVGLGACVGCVADGDEPRGVVTLHGGV